MRKNLAYLASRNEVLRRTDAPTPTPVLEKFSYH